MTKQPDGTIELSLTIPQTEIKSTKQKLIFEAGKTLEIKGFRKGKAPLTVVEQHLDQTKLSGQVLDQLLPPILASELKKNNLKPISNPHLKVVSMQPNSDWQFTVELAEFPKFELADYQSKVKSALATSKIVTSPDAPKPSPDQNLKKLFDALLEIDVPISKLLIDDEVTKALSKLLHQIQKLGLTLDQYLASLKKTPESLRQEYTTTARDNLKLEFILQQIADDLKITITDSDIDALLKTLPEPHPQRAYIASVLRKRKTIDALLKLA